MSARHMAAGAKPLRIAVGADHGGVVLKERLIRLLESKGIAVADMGTHSSASCDYPKIGYKVATAISQRLFDRGILLCRSGIGIAITANKVPGVRAAVCNDLADAVSSRGHNDANILVMGAERVSERKAKKIVETWLETRFVSGSRHERRVKQIHQIEKSMQKGKEPW